MSKAKWLLGVCVPALALGAGTPALAQDTGFSLTEIVVTARKTSESLIEVPLAISAMTAADLEAKDVNSLADFTRYVPGFSLSNSTNQRNDRSGQSLFIRGVVPISASTVSPATSVFINGAPVTSGFVEGISDLERAEVLKGPQSAYFGRAAFAGAVNLVTRDPGNEWKGMAEATLGNYQYVNLRGSIEGPIVEDKLMFRVSGRIFDADGQYKNAHDGQDLGSQSTKSLSGSLLFRPNDNLTAKIFGLVWRDDDGPTSVAKFRGIDHNCNAGRAPAGQMNYICGKLPKFPESRVGVNVPITDLFREQVLENGQGFFTLYDSFIDHAGLERKAAHVNGQIEYEIPDSGFTLTSLTGYNTEKRNTVQNSIQEDVSHISVPANILGYPAMLLALQQESEDFSQEFRVNYNQNNGFRVLLGGSYYESTQDLAVYGIAHSVLTQFTLPSPSSNETYGLFGSVSVDITPEITITGEARYQVDKIQVDDRFGDLLAEAKFKSFMPRAIIEWNFAESNMVYASVARGVNPGAFNTTLLNSSPATIAAVEAATGATTVVEPEKLLNFEIGYKGRFWNDRAQLTAAIYRANYTDQIVQDYVPVPHDTNPNIFNIMRPLSNVGKTRLQGIELELAMAPVDNLSVNVSYGLSDTNVRKYRCTVCFQSLTGSFDVTGNSLPNVPKNKLSVSAEWRDSFTPSYDWYVMGEYQYRDGLWDTVANLAKTSSQNLVNARLGLANEVAGIELYVLNLFNDDAYTSIGYSADLARTTDNSIVAGLASKRRYGVRLNYKF